MALDAVGAASEPQGHDCAQLSAWVYVCALHPGFSFAWPSLGKELG